MITKIERLFGSRTRVAVLGKLLMHPQRSFYLRELSKEVGITLSAVHKELANLRKLDLVTSEEKGRLKLFRINTASPIYGDLKKLFIKTESIGSVLKSSLSNVKGIKYALVYGSIAKGTEVETSDVDLLLVGEIDEEELLGAVRKAEGKIGREINYVVWTESEFKKKIRERHHLLREIAAAPVLMLIGDENEFRGVVAE